MPLPARRARPRPLARLRATAATLLAGALLLAGGPASALTGDEDDLGARALREDGWSEPHADLEDVTRSGPVVPTSPPITNVTQMTPSYYADGCHVFRSGTTVLPGCVYGDVDSEVEVAVLGSSKVGQYFPALEEIALREGWRLRMYTKLACSFTDEPEPTYPECDAYKADLREHLAEHPPDLVITGGMRQDVADGYTRTWTWLRGLGVEEVVALWDSPGPTGGNPAACVAQAIEEGESLSSCAVWLLDQHSGNPSMREAAAQVHGASFVDLRDWVCPSTHLDPRCPAVVGRAQLYGSGSHLVPSYTATLTDPLHQRLHEAGIAAYRPSVDRVGGADRYATAALLARDAAPGGRVFLTSGADFPDALAAAAKAGAQDEVVLLTRGASLPSVTREALLELEPSQVLVVGGEEAVPQSVLEEVAELAPAERVAGSGRYETAAALAEVAPVVRGEVVYVATGEAFPDALAAAAQAGQASAPILLVRHDEVPVATEYALDALDPERVVVVGGEAAISGDVLEDLRRLAPDVGRVGGSDRYATAALLADGAQEVLHVGSGLSFADALAAAPVAAAADGAVLLTEADRVPAATSQALQRLAPERVVLTGGAGVVGEDVRRALLRLAS
ncbi:Putative cell wall-binding domain [Serinicoccus hydrothermalis]|uniref:Cell wall-binding domain n=1 Tax=Serinicoccus hydrothermalis TaxID=1758689 RepID=A0A1B1NE89_9MICO|nr:cell wall-binding repeat-containing protein [Serinicoccus hydrothermalis]ANS79759.1 Putative cell wall-binding domain [Serinicoccus hydrothermalis]